jgi:hypothetical protein
MVSNNIFAVKFAVFPAQVLQVDSMKVGFYGFF